MNHLILDGKHVRQHLRELWQEINRLRGRVAELEKQKKQGSNNVEAPEET